MRYGALPVVSRVGGLNDTVIDANEAALSAGVATGIQFAPVTREGLEQALARTAEFWRKPKIWRRCRGTAWRRMSAGIAPRRNTRRSIARS